MPNNTVRENKLTHGSLLPFFQDSIAKEGQNKIGVEFEVSGVHQNDFSPLRFEGSHQIDWIFDLWSQKHGLSKRIMEGDRCYGFLLEHGNITLEPGGQIEFSSAPYKELSEIEHSLQLFLQDLQDVEKATDLRFYTAGVNPFHRLDQMDWNSKSRYKIMRKYLGTRGTLGHVMMTQTMSFQYNIDFHSEQDAVLKYNASRKWYATVQFLSSNSMIYEGKPRTRPLRSEVWENTDNDRSGMPPEISSFQDYIDYALEIPMFFITRDGKSLPFEERTTFQDFWDKGAWGYEATVEDWHLHLSTLFPEVRFKKRALELRMFDASDPSMFMSFSALVKGIFYHSENLQSLLREDWSADWSSVQRLIDLAKKGLSSSEWHYLDAFQKYQLAQKNPGEVALEMFEKSGHSREKLLEHLAFFPSSY